MDLRVLLSTLFLLGVVCLPALKAEDLSKIDSPMMDWIEEDGLTRIDHEMESDDYDHIDDDTDDDDDDEPEYACSQCKVEGNCKADPDPYDPLTLVNEVYKNLPAEDCKLIATHFFEECSNTEDMPITATYTDKNGKSSISKINKKIANSNL